MKDSPHLGASFRDPSGFLFRREGILYRQVNQAYAADYTRLMDSGLYERLTKAGLLIAHQEASIDAVVPELAFKVLQPDRVPFISYPYEWPFSLFKDAAMATLSIQKRALKAGTSLKDASAYNMQLVNGKVTLIDSLSFELYQEGKPWVAYRQFCQHFLAPLALMAHVDVRLGQLMRVYIDGVPLDLASRLLPWQTRLNFGLLTHIHIHAGAQRRFAASTGQVPRNTGRMTKAALLGLIESLESTVKGLQWKSGGTEWADYYSITNYSQAAFDHKKELISSWLDHLQASTVWDLGANDGTFSRLASERHIHTVAFDIDPTAVESNYRHVKSAGETDLVPLVLDLANPSPAIGWHNRERESLAERGPADVVFALALIHHLAISNNVPLALLADFFHEMGRWLIIEFVPKTDSQVQRLLQSRVDIFPQYTAADFEAAFGRRFVLKESVSIRESDRRLYLMQRKGNQ